jgi:hypothetical protein
MSSTRAGFATKQQAIKCNNSTRYDSSFAGIKQLLKMLSMLC